MPECGDPWPNGRNGEVVSPSGKRSYDLARVHELTGRTERWARKAAKDEVVLAEKEPGGHGRWFLNADDFESKAAANDWVGSTDEDAWSELVTEQGRDLDKARKALTTAKRRLSGAERKLAAALADRKRLLNMVAELSRMAADVDDGSAFDSDPME